MITCFLTPEDFKEIRSTGGRDLSPYFILQVMTVSRNGGISQAQFDAFATTLETKFGDQFEEFWQSRKADIDANLDRAEGSLSEFLGSEVELEIGQPAPLETTRVSDTEVMSVWMSKMSGTVEGQTIVSRQVQTSTALLVKGRVIVLFGYQRYKDAADIESLKKLTAEWVNGIAELNL